jgi:hypothetical protein
MEPEFHRDCIPSLIEALQSRQMKSGGWAYFSAAQEGVEATCLATLALMGDSPRNATRAVGFLREIQRADGAWPAFLGDPEGNWTTALALCALNLANDFTTARERAFRWLVAERGREAHWLWRWKFKTVDRKVRFDPDKYGWPWISGSASWVIPTAFSIIAMKQFTICKQPEAAAKRIHLGIKMLLDRACMDGGWNSGNSVVYGVPLRAHVEATAIALMGLQNEPRSEIIQKSLAWLKHSAMLIDSVSSLAWCILTLFVYQEPIQQLRNGLAKMVADGREIQNNATLAIAILALNCGERAHPFVVLG